MPSPPIYDYNEVEDLLPQKSHYVKRQKSRHPNATRINRDWRRDPYFGYKLHFSNMKGPCEELPQFEPYVEYSLNKKKRWNEVTTVLQAGKFASRPAGVTLSSPKRGSNWWKSDNGFVDRRKLDERLVGRAAQKGKSKNMTFVSLCNIDTKPTLHFNIVRCYDDTPYSSQLLKYRRRLDRQKRRTSSKLCRRLFLEEEDV